MYQYIDSSKFSKSEMLNTLTDDIETTQKLQILNLMYNKLYGMIMLDTKSNTILTDSIYNVVKYGDELAVNNRLLYTRFRNESIAYDASVLLRNDNIKDIFIHSNYFQILKYILKSYKLTDEIKQDVYNELRIIFNDERTIINAKMEIADIFILSGNYIEGNLFLDRLRNIHVDIKQNNNVYTDSQNVHNSDINKSVLRVSHYLIEKYKHNFHHKLMHNKPLYDYNKVYDEFSKGNKGHEIAIEEVLRRIEIDTAKFEYNEDSCFNLYTVFAAVLLFVGDNKDMKERLKEELLDMHNYCATGHLSRLVNTIQGYTDDENLLIKISDIE